MSLQPSLHKSGLASENPLVMKQLGKLRQPSSPTTLEVNILRLSNTERSFVGFESERDDERGVTKLPREIRRHLNLVSHALLFETARSAHQQHLNCAPPKGLL
ncbi:hypothetical protein R77567_03277 [Ralstonia sp. LMG 32965]|uniref:Uncharacterized protein n=1 Tax=Ralstonia flatus TaxID=3058601 RepID=A0AAD2C1S3_9RALS|nr:hypothetical protein R77567_03277 [Ralstonia sp. LMG 32965]CAJ0887743.1 hypothetical protein R77564_03233 [Ralstonia sp. LMG 32965]